MGAATSQDPEKFEDYEGFVEKFKPKRTTDDCYTPPRVYEVVRDWACAEYGIDPATIVRPFYPGGDYEHFDYPEGCVVLDNPPFSCLSEIRIFYQERGIGYFLFAPALTMLSGPVQDTAIAAYAQIIYENGAKVNTGFVTNMDDKYALRSAPDLYRSIKQAQAEPDKRMPVYEYPDDIITAAIGNRYAKYGIDFRVPFNECVKVSGLDSQKAAGKAIYGRGLLLSERMAAERAAAERAAAERAAAERAAAHRWELSERERKLQRSL